MSMQSQVNLLQSKNFSKSRVGVKSHSKDIDNKTWFYRKWSSNYNLTLITTDRQTSYLITKS